MVDQQGAQGIAPADAARLRDERSEAFRRLSEAHLDRSYRLAWAILGDPTEAEDAVQDAWVNAWRSAPSRRDDDRFDAWFTRIVVNTCRNRLRSQARARVTDISEHLDLRQDRDAFAAIHDRDQLRRALNTLNDDQRAILALRFQADLTIDQIAARLGLPAGTVKSRLHYALQGLHAVVDGAIREGALR